MVDSLGAAESSILGKSMCIIDKLICYLPLIKCQIHESEYSRLEGENCGSH